MSSQLSSRRDRQMVRILSLLDGISYFPHGKSEMLRRKSEMLRGIWHFLRGKREMPHGFCGCRVENAKYCAEFGTFRAEKRNAAPEFGIFRAEKGKCCKEFWIFCAERAKFRSGFPILSLAGQSPLRMRFNPLPDFRNSKAERFICRCSANFPSQK